MGIPINEPLVRGMGLVPKAGGRSAPRSYFAKEIMDMAKAKPCKTMAEKLPEHV